MTILIAKIVFGVVLLVIAIQDFKDRRVWLFLFLLQTVLGGWMFYNNSEPSFFWLNTFINLGAIISILLISYVIMAYVFKKKKLQESMGWGDVLFLFGFAVSFPTLSFLNFFIFSIFFTLAIHFLQKKGNKKQPSIPLAGSQSIFLLLVYGANWLGFYPNIYSI